MPFVTPPTVVVGYHGTTEQKAAEILANGFELSRNPHDWLGDGVYYFELAPTRAADFALKKYRGDRPCVLESRILLADCLDLTDAPGIKLVTAAYEDFVARFGRDTLRRLRQTAGGRRVDCAVLNRVCRQLEETGQRVGVVRCAFREVNESPVWVDPDGELAPSGIDSGNHVQLAVRDTSLIMASRIAVEYECVDDG
jgi:hypothetical protein